METKEPKRGIEAPNGSSRFPVGPEFLSRSEVAGLFGVSLPTVTRWARTGLLPAVRTPGGHYRYRAEDVRRAARPGLAARLLEPQLRPVLPRDTGKKRRRP